MVDVIIPAYNAHETIEQTLFSIAYQDFSDKLKVYIVNDCSDNDYSELVNYFSKFIDITELKLDINKGPGYARQHGINNSNSEYIVFIDADDVFADCYAISNLYNEINKTGCDLIISDFVEETDQHFMIKTNDTVWVHGKIYRREFLNKHDIKFNDTRSNEDNGFNQTILFANAKVKFYNKKTYIWRNNKKSITRKDNFRYRFDGLMGYVYNIKWALDNGIKFNGDSVKIGSLSFACLVYIYCSYLEYRDEKSINDLLIETKKVKDIYLKYPLPEETQLNILERQLKAYYNANTRKIFLKSTFSFWEYFKMLDEV